MKRLSKVLSEAGVASRRKCEELIFEKKVQVNGKIILLPQTMVDPANDHITVDGQQIFLEDKVYFLLNKPKGYTCTNKKQKGILRAIDLFKHLPYRLFTVGRLDKMTSGLLIVTNDGQLSHRIMHPSFQIEKEYLLKVQENILDRHIKKMQEGIIIENAFVQPLRVKKVRRGTCKIILCDGKKHEVRKIVQNAGLHLLELVRIRIGPIVLGDLPMGTYREMRQNEKNVFFNCF